MGPRSLNIVLVTVGLLLVAAAVYALWAGHEVVFSSLFTVGAGSLILAAVSSTLMARTSELVEARRRHLEDLKKLAQYLLCGEPFEPLGRPLPPVGDGESLCAIRSLGETVPSMCNKWKYIMEDHRLRHLFEDLDNHFYLGEFRRRGLASTISELCNLVEQLSERFFSVLRAVDERLAKALDLGVLYSMLDDDSREALAEEVAGKLKRHADYDQLAGLIDKAVDAILGDRVLVKGVRRASGLASIAVMLLERVMTSYTLPGSCRLIAY